MATRYGAGVIGSPTLTSTWKVTSARAREQARVTRTPAYCSSSLITSARACSGEKTSPSCSDAPDHPEDGLDVAVDVLAMEVNVLGRATGVEGGEEHPSLEHEPSCFGHAAL